MSITWLSIPQDSTAEFSFLQESITRPTFARGGSRFFYAIFNESLNNSFLILKSHALSLSKEFCVPP